MKITVSLLILTVLAFACKYTRQRPIIPEEAFLKMHLIIERSPVDTVKFKFDKFLLQYKVPTTPDLISPGYYRGESPYDDYGYKHIISFRIDHLGFSDVQYNEIPKDGHGKATDTSYCRKMNAAVPGSAPNISYPYYISQIESKQDLKKIDGVSGATYSKFRFQYAAIKAIAAGPYKK